MSNPKALPLLICIAFMLGVAIGFELTDVKLSPWLLIFALLLLCVLFYRSQKLLFPDNFFGISTFLIFTFLGIFNFQIHQPNQVSNHFVNLLDDSPHQLQLQIKEILKSNSYQQNYIAEVQKLDSSVTQGKILLSLPLGSADYNPGDKLWAVGEPQEVYKPLNPYQFNYAEYLKNKQVPRQLRLSDRQIIKLEKDSTSMVYKADWLRNQIEKNLYANHFSKEQVTLMQALLLGQRRDLSRTVYNQFAEAGVVHILAVSGLHVGIVLYFILLILKPLQQVLPAKWVTSFLAVFLLWVYAYLAGMSPSIIRAVSMFSFLSIGLLSKRRVFTFNMLCLSAFILLLINPYNLFDIGFQLSYSAVVSILLFARKIQRFCHPKNWWTRKVTDWLSVTIAAQLGVLPLSLYYFHQFPTLFFLSNLIIIPFLGFILGSGFLVILWSSIAVLPPFVVWIYGGILDSLLQIVNWFAVKEHFILKNIYFSYGLLWVSVLLLVCIGLYLYRKKTVFLFSSLIAILFLQIIWISESRRLEKNHKLYVFHQSRASVLGIQNGRKLKLLASPQQNNLPPSLAFIKGFKEQQGIKELEYKLNVPSHFIFKDESWLVIDSLSIWEINPVPVDYILLKDSPKINLERLILHIQPKQIIADGSNYKSYVNNWEQTCKIKKIPFHYTGEKGAFVIHYDPY